MQNNGQQYEEIGLIKYSGENLPNGIIDAKSAGFALIGLDEAIRFFNKQQSRNFSSAVYDIPVQTRSGSWEAVVLAGTAVAGAFALGYAKKAGEKMAENDFKEIGLKDILSKSMAAIQTLAKTVKTTNKSGNWEELRIEPTIGSMDLIVLKTPTSDDFKIPLEFYRWYQQMPSHILARMTSAIRKDRTLTITSIHNNKTESTTLVEADRPLFEEAEEDDLDDGAIFPELTHGSSVTLDGRLIRGSEASNSVGLEYLGHIINCIPDVGSIRQYKPALFLRCRVTGLITRHSKSRFVADKRPTLIIQHVTPLEKDSQGKLFPS